MVALEIVAGILVVCGTFLAALQMYLTSETARDIRHETARKEQNKEREIERVLRIEEHDNRLAELEKAWKAQQWSKK